MRHGSLFSGIGGFDLAAEWMGWDNVFHCEWNKFGQQVLKYYWPNSISYNDITKTDFTIHRGNIDILTGGFPCQPYSSAGKRLGKEDERHLWPEMLRAIREIQPRWVVGENVLGLVNWSGGLVFHEVQTDLEAEGYEVQPYVLPAVSVNAPHRRDRVWFVAYSKNNGCSGRNKFRKNIGVQERSLYKCEGQRWDEIRPKSERFNEELDATNTYKSRPETFNNKESILGEKDRTKTFSRNSIESIHTRKWWDSFPSVSPVHYGNDGISDRLDSITFFKWRNESIKAGGNAIVPQVVYQIFKTIEQYERINTPDKNS
jgi:DNA (cytosine-5)-methyltransferase 1